jgi:hypothetical protein
VRAPFRRPSTTPISVEEDLRRSLFFEQQTGFLSKWPSRLKATSNPANILIDFPTGEQIYGWYSKLATHLFAQFNSIVDGAAKLSLMRLQDKRSRLGSKNFARSSACK